MHYWAKMATWSAGGAGPRGRSLDHVLKSQQDLNTPYVDRRSTGGSDGFASAADPPLIFEGCHFGRCWNHFGTFWGHFGLCCGNFGNFGVIWGAKLEPNVGLEAPGGPLAPPRGTKGPFGSPRVPFWSIWGSFGVILGSFGVPNWSQKSVLRHLVGPLAPPRGPKEPLGSPSVPFWLILESFWGHF